MTISIPTKTLRAFPNIAQPRHLMSGRSFNAWARSASPRPRPVDGSVDVPRGRKKTQELVCWNLRDLQSVVERSE